MKHLLTIAGSDSSGGAGIPGRFKDLCRPRHLWYERYYCGNGAKYTGRDDGAGY